MHSLHWILLGNLNREFYVRRVGKGRLRPGCDVKLMVQFRPKQKKR